jgi:hypothetical protein
MIPKTSESSSYTKAVLKYRNALLLTLYERKVLIPPNDECADTLKKNISTPLNRFSCLRNWILQFTSMHAKMRLLFCVEDASKIQKSKWKL